MDISKKTLFKVREQSDNFILLKKKTEKVFNSNVYWSLWESFLVVVLSSALFGFCINYTNLNFNLAATPLNQFAFDSSTAIISIGKSIFILTLLWLILTLTSAAINHYKNGYSDIVCNIAQIFALVYATVLPFSLLFLYSFHPSIKSFLWLFFNLILLVFYFNLFGVFVYASSERTASEGGLSFVYTTKRLSIKKVLISIIPLALFIIIGVFYLIFYSPLAIIINKFVLFRAVFVLLSLFVTLGFFVEIGTYFRKTFEEADQNPRLTSFYGYSKTLAIFIFSIMALDFIFKIFQIDINNDINLKYYFILTDFLIFGYMTSLVYATKMVCLDTGYKYTFAENKKLDFFKIPKKSNVQTFVKEENPDISSLSEEVLSDNLKEPEAAIHKEEQKSTSYFVDIKKSSKDFINKLKESEQLRPLFWVVNQIKNALNFITFDSILNASTELSKKQRLLCEITVFLGTGIVFSFGKRSFLEYTINTNIWYSDIFIGGAAGIIFVLFLALGFFFISRMFKASTNIKDIFSQILLSLLPMSVISIICMLFFKKDYMGTLIEYTFYVFIFWAVSYLFLYYYSKLKSDIKKTILICACNITTGFLLFFILSNLSFAVQKGVYNHYKYPYVRVMNTLKDDCPKNISPVLDKVRGLNFESIDLVELSIGDVLEHADFMSRYKAETELSDSDISYNLYSMRIGNENRANNKWARFLYKNQPKNISESENKIKSILDFVQNNISEEETTYPFGDAFWQDSVTTFKRKAGKIPDIAVLITAMMRANGTPARISQEVTPDRYFNNSYNLVEYYDNEKKEWIPCYPKNSNVKPNKKDINDLSTWLSGNYNSKSMGFYYIHDGILYPVCSNKRNEKAVFTTDLLPGKYMAFWRADGKIKNYFFEIRVSE